jgi:hypothetical protein
MYGDNVNSSYGKIIDFVIWVNTVTLWKKLPSYALCSMLDLAAMPRTDWAFNLILSKSYPVEVKTILNLYSSVISVENNKCRINILVSEDLKYLKI